MISAFVRGGSDEARWEAAEAEAAVEDTEEEAAEEAGLKGLD